MKSASHTSSQGRYRHRQTGVNRRGSKKKNPPNGFSPLAARDGAWRTDG